MKVNPAVNLFILFAFFLVSITGCASHQEKEDDSAALRAAQSWLNYLDNGSTEELWSATSSLTKEKEDKELMLKLWTGIRKGLGELRQRDLQLNFVVAPYQFRGSIPDGTYRRILFWSKYERRELAREELLMSFEDGQWKCLQYLVK